ncbi:zinc finger protein 236 [Amyelois transitella]|uniref:zinc finger protein 236 n=1 Tax=Amyelois transitella TaxID=680683 RepID=UPI00067AC831|nr:zinc finger protein 236 [Amyelois transitella]
MASALDLKLVLHHLLNGDLEENLCRICLQPLPELREDIYTRICKDEQEYCIADVLEEICSIKFAETDKYYVCLECFQNASNAYKFFLKTKRNNDMLTFYVNEMESNVNCIEIPESLMSEALCISLSEYEPLTPDFDYNLDGVLKKGALNMKSESQLESKKEVVDKDDDHIVIIKSEGGLQTYYRPLPDGSLAMIKMEKQLQAERKRKKREPMTFKQCTRCPIKYRFVAKLKEHMKMEHGVILHACKICQALIEDEQEYRQHLKTHTNIHQCDICDTVFQKRDIMISHIKWHETNKQTDGHVCKMCGEITSNEEDLRNHCDKKHYKGYTCYYCGRMYKGRISFDKHIEKHEKFMKLKEMKHKSPSSRVAEEPPAQTDRRFTCETCGRSFLGERALMWHNRLHTNERPYTCETCGRGFVSCNRRNQHALCAHSAPTRRCPLCPALFHLRSMVNTHIKKVHLKTHKRRHRTMRHQEVLWETETVPIQELSVDIQDDILELQAAKELDSGVCSM